MKKYEYYTILTLIFREIFLKSWNCDTVIILVILYYLNIFKTIWDHLGQFETVWDSLRPFGST